MLQGWLGTPSLHGLLLWPSPQPRPGPLSWDTGSWTEQPRLGALHRAPSPVSPWKVGRSRGSPCQHRCMRRSRWLQARGLALQTGGSSGRWPFTTFTMMCRMFFSSARERHRRKGRAGPLSPEGTQLWGSAEGHAWGLSLHLLRPWPGDHSILLRAQGFR